MASSVRRIARHYGCSLSVPLAAVATTAQDASLSPGSGNFSFAVWIRYTVNTTGTIERIVLANASWTDGMMIYSGNGTGDLVVVVRNGAGYVDIPMDSGVGFNNWHRLVVSCTASSKTLAVYLDGILVQSNAGAWVGDLLSTCALSIGDGTLAPYQTRPTWCADAVLDIGHAWTAADVLADYQTGNPPSTYTHRWPLDDGAGTTARATRGGLPLTLSGGAAFSLDSPMLGRNVVRNHVAQSESLTTTPWGGLTNLTIGNYVGTLPSPLAAMQQLQDTTDGGSVFHSVQQASVPVVVGEEYIVSFFIKPVAGSGWMATNCCGCSSYFKTDGTVGVGGTAIGPTGVLSRAAELQPDGSYRCWQRFIAASQLVVFYTASADNTVGYQGSSANKIAVGGFMIEKVKAGQTTPSPYVATAAAPLAVYGMRERRQNFAWPSEDQSVSPWVASGVTLLANQGAASVGQYTKLTDTAANSAHSITTTQTLMHSGAPPVPVGNKMTFWVRVKAGTKSWVLLAANNDAETLWFNAATGQYGTISGNASIPTGYTPIQTAPGEWLVGMTFTVRSIPNSARWLDVWMVNGDNQTSYLGDTTGTLFIAGVQLVAGDCIPAYIKTTTTVVNPNGAPRQKAA